jgi:hypothetical protein
MYFEVFRPFSPFFGLFFFLPPPDQRIAPLLILLLVLDPFLDAPGLPDVGESAIFSPCC